MGRSLHGHYLDLRLDRAHQLRRESTLTATEIAASTGFAGADALSRAERRRHGHPVERITVDLKPATASS